MGNKSKQSKMKWIVLATAVLAVIVSVIVVFLNQEEAPAVETAQVDVSGQPTLGESNAPVTVVEYGDFKCPSCKAWGEMI